MARKKKNGALVVKNGSSELTEIQLSPADKLLARGLFKLGHIVLDHERRIGSLEDALGELAGEEPKKSVVDVEAE